MTTTSQHQANKKAIRLNYKEQGVIILLPYQTSIQVMYEQPFGRNDIEINEVAQIFSDESWCITSPHDKIGKEIIEWLQIQYLGLIQQTLKQLNNNNT